MKKIITWVLVGVLCLFITYFVLNHYGILGDKSYPKYSPEYIAQEQGEKQLDEFLEKYDLTGESEENREVIVDALAKENYSVLEEKGLLNTIETFQDNLDEDGESLNADTQKEYEKVIKELDEEARDNMEVVYDDFVKYKEEKKEEEEDNQEEVKVIQEDEKIDEDIEVLEEEDTINEEQELSEDIEAEEETEEETEENTIDEDGEESDEEEEQQQQEDEDDNQQEDEDDNQQEDDEENQDSGETQEEDSISYDGLVGTTEKERQVSLLSTYGHQGFKNLPYWEEAIKDSGIDVSFIICISLEETELGNNMNWNNNVGNAYGKDYESEMDGITGITTAINSQLLKNYNQIKHLSRYGNPTGPIYSDDEASRHNTIIECMSFLKGSPVPDDYNFRID